MSSNITFTGTARGWTITPIDNLISAERPASDTAFRRPPGGQREDFGTRLAQEQLHHPADVAEALRSSDIDPGPHRHHRQRRRVHRDDQRRHQTGSYSIQVNLAGCLRETEMSESAAPATAIGSPARCSFSAGGTTFDVGVSDTDTSSTLATKINKAGVAMGSAPRSRQSPMAASACVVGCQDRQRRHHLRDRRQRRSPHSA
jgi:hypothetical protein